MNARHTIQGRSLKYLFIIEPRRCQINQFIQNWHQIVVNHHSAFQYTLWLFNIAMENGPFIDGLPVYLSKMVSFHGYVSHNQMVITHFFHLGSWGRWRFGGSRVSHHVQTNPMLDRSAYRPISEIRIVWTCTPNSGDHHSLHQTSLKVDFSKNIYTCIYIYIRISLNHHVNHQLKSACSMNPNHGVYLCKSMYTYIYIERYISYAYIYIYIFTYMMYIHPFFLFGP